MRGKYLSIIVEIGLTLHTAWRGLGDSHRSLDHIWEISVLFRGQTVLSPAEVRSVSGRTV